MNTITTQALSELANPVVIDVREPFEYVSGHAPAAASIPLGELVARVEELDRDETVYVICESGGRSAQAVEWLNTQGFDAVNVEGGTSVWRNAGLPVSKDN
ncbi:rhodanese-like domain-containing protein [Salinibacterium sp. SWN167]|uniref:rhodanese-like domain-containing protein n=1 Tax=Salinibacterium sp. SWN167 TaxID=2792054 RepID=UPI0018CE2253|nr:rhodanese-like domain-containing protein [Salinibacterium sp. SWN167]MBH0082442.1 rhodanese-like domain-containing protein [Salinibacterium sp. SWN167]